eukprot:sb/3477779/
MPVTPMEPYCFRISPWRNITSPSATPPVSKSLAHLNNTRDVCAAVSSMSPSIEMSFPKQVGALRSFAAKSRAPPFLRIVIAPSFQLQSKNDPQVFERSCRDLQKT